MGSHTVVARRTASLKPTQARQGGRSQGADSIGQSSLDGTLAIAEEKGLLKGRRTLVIRGRMPEELVEAARQKTGIVSDSQLLEAALANLAVGDAYAEWL